MARRKSENLPTNPVGEKILRRSMEEIMPQSMLPYAEHVILERALPRIEDGLKPVQRRILYTMLELGTTPDKPHRKSARIVGDCLGKYHPHGDSSVYDAMVRMAQTFNMRATLVDGHGNFGSVDGDDAAAMRYTEARMTPLALEMLRDLDKDSVDFTLNFDDTLREPVVLPGRFPNLLVNGASGIAVGLATNIPPHNLGETIDAVIMQIENPSCTVEDLLTCLPGPDFPTGAELLQSDEIRKAYETGKGHLILRAKTSIEKANAGKTNLVITQLPYQVNKASLLERILRLSEEKKGPLAAVSDIRDESDRTGMRAVVELKKDTDAGRVLAYLYKATDLQTSFHVNMVAIADGKPVQLSLKRALEAYLAHQKNVVRRRTAYDLEKAKAREHVLEGLMIAVENLDEVIRLIRCSKSTREAKEALMQNFVMTDMQAQAVLDLRLYRLTGLEIDALRKEYTLLKKQIAELSEILRNEKKLLSLIKKELLDIKKRFSQDRATQIVGVPSHIPAYVEEKEVKPCVLATDGTLIRRLMDKKDTVPQGWCSLSTFTNQKIILFTNLGNSYVFSPEDVAITRGKDRALAGLLAGWEKEETALALFDESQKGSFLFFTQKGLVKRTACDQYGMRKGRASALKLKEQDSVFAVLASEEEQKDILLLTKKGMGIRFALEQVSSMGRATSGVHAITLGKDDEAAFVFLTDRKGELLLFSENGYAKRSLLLDHDLQTRGGKGQRAFTFAKGNGSYVFFAALLKKNCICKIELKDGSNTEVQSDEILMLPRAAKGSPCLFVEKENPITKILITDLDQN